MSVLLFVLALTLIPLALADDVPETAQEVRAEGALEVAFRYAASRG